MSTEVAIEEILQYKPRIRYRSPLDNILETRGMPYELFKYYVGVLNACVLTMNDVTGKEEYHDIKNVIFSDRPIRFVPGMEIHIENNNVRKISTYKRLLYGTFHKWEMVSGQYLILSQKEVDSLTQTERRNLRMNL